MNEPKPKRIPLGEEVRIAQAVAETLRLKGIDETDEDFAELLDSECDLRERLVNMARVAQRSYAMAEAIKAIIEKNRIRQARLKSKADHISDAILWAMQEAGIAASIESPDVTIVIGKGRETVRGEDATQLPDHLRRTKHEPDKVAIKAALKAGQEVPGFTLVNNGEPTISIKAT